MQNASMVVPALMGTAVVGLGLEEVAVREVRPCMMVHFVYMST